MNILLSNDDGINAEGLFELAGALSADNNVIVIAPDGERSASGHSISLKKILKYKKEDIFLNAEAYSLTGTPADCVKFGILELVKNKIDLVVSGINHGRNLGTDVFYSGTVSAAMEGFISGHKAIAVSCCGKGNYDFKYAAQFIRKNLDYFYNISASPSVINVNFPDCGHEDIKGVKITPLGRRKYNDVYKVSGISGEEGYILESAAEIKAENPEDCDVEWSGKNYVTVTPLKLDLTDGKILKKMDSKDISL